MKDAMAPTPPLPVTEDTPPDMLAGSMDLRVVLPSGHSVKMSVERSTPMMDLLVQVTTVNKLSTGGHVLQAIGDRGVLPYKPSTPIGALDTWTIQVVPKSKVQVSTLQKKAPLKPSNQQQPFEQTFRLQVHLPRNQLYVMRVSPRTVLSDILYQTCSEKNLNPNKYELRHPANLSQLLDPSCTLADYGLQEVTVVARRTPGLGSALSSSDIMALQREEDKRRQQARQQHRADHGLGLVLNKRSQSSVCEGSVSSDSLGGRSISPARSDESASRSASPPAPSLPPMMVPDPPARPARKRRPAPKPPGPVDVTPGNNQHSGTNVQAEPSSAVNGKMNQVPVSHSRNSSDSSGYHEASVLSESPADGHQMPESCTAVRPKSRAGLSRSMSSLTGCQHSTSTTSLASSTGPSGQKKKKAAPPPPGMQKHSDQDICESQKTTSLERHLSGKTSSQLPGKCSTLPGKMKMSEHEYKSTMVEESREQKIPELEEDMVSPDIQKIISSSKVDVTATNIQNGVSVPKQDEIGIPHITNNRHSERQDNANIAKVSKEVFPLADDVGVGKNEHSHVEKDVSEKKASVAVFPKEISLYSEDASVANFTKNPTQEDAKHLRELSPETDHSSVNSLSKNSPPQLPEYATASKETSLRASDDLPIPVQRDIVPVPATLPVERTATPEETDAINQVEEAFRSVTEELDEQPPSPPADDLTVDWEYQLPAPPSAFRDSHSPTLTELGTVTLADAQVFQESSLSPEPVSLDAFTKPPVNSDVDDMLLGGSTTRTNPLFDPRYCEDESSVPQESTQSRRGELTNFTISTYQKPPVVEAIFNEYSDDEQISSSVDVFKKPVSYKYGSMSSLVNNSSTANLSRTNSFHSTENSTSEPPVSTASVKRSTSYICLVPRVNRTKSSENLSGQESKSAQCDNVTAVSSQQGKSVSNLEAKGSSSNDNSATKSQVVMTEEERARLLALQEQFLQLQEQLLQNSNLLQPQQQDSPLQSLQVLRSILPQLKTSSNNTSSVTLSSETQQVKVEQEPTQPVKVEEEPVKQTAEKPVNDNENKRYSYRGPPAINFATWSERPKSQVSIKQDRDYRIGIGQGGRVDDHKTGVSEAKHDATNADEPIRKVEPPSLSMRLISHTTASGFRKPASGSYQKSGSSNYVVENSCTPVSTRIECAPPPAPSDPSRVPIVRAVELKKSFLQQQNLLSDRDEQTFAGVNSLAKRFSSNVRLCRPASAYGKVENIDEVKGDGSTLSYKSVSSTNINTAPANVNTSSRRYTSVVGINSDFDRGLSSSSFRDPTLESSRVQPRVSGPSVVRVNGFTSAKQLMPVVKGFQFATPAANKDSCPPNSHTKIHRSESTSGLRSWKTVGTDQQADVRRDSRELKPEPVIKVTTTNQESQPPPPPPVLAAALRKSTARPRPKTLPSPQQNPRDQLMDAIRNFGGRANLKQNGRS